MTQEEFNALTIKEVGQKAEDEPYDEMPGTGQQRPGPWRRLLGEMTGRDAATVGDLGDEDASKWRFNTRSQYGDFFGGLLAPEELEDLN